MIPVQVSINKNEIIFKNEDKKMVYKTDINSFVENTGLTIQDIKLPFYSTRVYYIFLNDKSSVFSCGNSLNNILLEIERTLEEGILIMDFNDVEEVSSSFLKTYTQFLLETPNKVITINMSPSISNDFGEFVSANILEYIEEEE